ncbi:SIMPL domain-containing protein [Terriglobus sp. TAA 43]|uniref:SIMPL domain-containing protein n=1 Tax=Terriglobus sp. TAA 43 TaxID=278961 RepID=UPI000647D44B|nr:SIMPL domain-containing protein [Terriglobus sp. TAA 43]
MRTTMIAAVAATLFAATSFAQVNQTLSVNKDNRSITVSATDSAFAMADQAVVNIGYQAYGEDEQGAYAEGSRRSNAISDALAAAHIPADTIESQDQNLQPLNEYELKNLPASLKNVKFRITQSWTVRTTPNDAAHVLDVAVKAGANQSGSIGWEMKDPSSLEAAASAKALAHAQAIAARMAEGLHIKVGSLLYASNQPQEIVRPMPMMAMAARAKTADTKQLSISARRVERSSTVFAIFSIE